MQGGIQVIDNDLQEVLRTASILRRHMSVALRHGGKYCEFGIQVFAQVHYGRDVTASVAVVWRAPYCDDGFVFEMPLRECLACA